MPRTIVPEEQQRTSDITGLKNVRPTDNRIIHVDSDADSEANHFRWDPSGEASNADGTTTIESSLSQYADGGAEEGLWRRMRLPFSAATTADLSEDSSNRYFTDSRAVSAIEDNTNTLQMSGGINLNSNSLTGLPTPSSGADAVTKEYVDGIAQGLEVKDSVDAAPTTNIDLTNTADPNPIDDDGSGGYTLQDGDRVLLKEQTDATENGIYVANTAADPSTWTLAEDFNEDDEVVSGAFTFVESGDTNGSTSYIVTTEDPITQGTDDIIWSQFSSAGEIIAGDGLSKSGNTLSANVSDFAGQFLSDDGNNDLQVDIGDGLTGTSGNIEVSLDIQNDGSSFATNEVVNEIDFGNNISLTDNTSGGGSLRVDVNASDSTSVDVQEDGSSVNSDTNQINYSSNVDVSDDGGNAVTVSVPDDEIQDATFDGGVLTGSQTRITVTYDNSNNEVSYVVDDDLNNYDNSTTDFISGIDVEDSGGSASGPFDLVNFGDDLSVDTSYGGSKQVKIESTATEVEVLDGGTSQTDPTEQINFSTGLTASSSTSGEVDVTNDTRFGTATFSGDGVARQFTISTTLSNKPSSWVIESTTDDGSGHSHSTANSSGEITVFYDTAPPNGTDNIQLNYSFQV